MRKTRKLTMLTALTAVFAMALAGLALADIVTNNVNSTAAGKILTVQAGSSQTVTYGVQNTNEQHGDTQNSCNPADGTALTIAPTGLPTGVSAPAAQATQCSSTAASILFSVGTATTPGDYAIGHTFSDSGGGQYQNQANFTLRVTAAPVTNTAPTLNLPSDVGPVEGNTLGGATVSYTASASDAEDGALTPSCSPASGSVFPVRTTTVNCSVTDSGGLSDSGSFTVTVVDTTAPQLSGVPGNQWATYSTVLGGAVISWTAPTANDIVDGALGPTCASAGGLGSGATFPLGTTQVTCSATDKAGNTGLQSFNVVVIYASTGILQPINSDGSSVFKINSTIPVKVQLSGDSAGYGGGNFTISLTRLGGNVGSDVNEPVVSTSAHTGNTLRYDSASDQYIFNLGTKNLSAGTYRVTVTLDDGTTRVAEFGLRK